MSLSSRIFIVCTVGLTAALAACGARSALDDAGGLGGGSASPATGATSTTSTASSTTASSGTGTLPRCALLALAEPPIVVEDPIGIHLPEIAQLPGGNVLLTRVGVPTLQLHGSEIDAFGAWPPSVPPPAVLFDGIDTYALGPGASGPVGYFVGPNGRLIATQVWPAPALVPAATGSEQALFVAGTGDLYFHGSASSFGVLEFGSYETSWLPQVEEPLVCVEDVLAAGVPSQQGFLAVMGRPNPPEPACSAQVPARARVITTARHDDTRDDVDLATTLADVMVTDEPLVRLALAGTSFGGWVVFQTDGSLSRVQPGLRAFPITANGQLRTPGADLVAVTQDGLGVGEIAAASLGDMLVVASVDAIDPSAPQIALQVVMPDGSLGTRASVPTAAAWLTGRIRLLASPAGDSLLVAWEGGLGLPVVGLARLSCAEGIK